MNKTVMTFVVLGLLSTFVFAQDVPVKNGENSKLFQKIENMVSPSAKGVRDGFVTFQKNIAQRKEFNPNFILQDINNVMDPYLAFYEKYGDIVYVFNEEIVTPIQTGWGTPFEILPFLREHGSDTISLKQNREYAKFALLLRGTPAVTLTDEQEQLVSSFEVKFFKPFVKGQAETKVENPSFVLQGILGVYESFLSQFAENVKEAEEGASVQAKDAVVVKALMQRMNKPFKVGWTKTPVVLSDYLAKHVRHVGWWPSRADDELDTFQIMLESASK